MALLGGSGPGVPRDVAVKKLVRATVIYDLTGAEQPPSKRAPLHGFWLKLSDCVRQCQMGALDSK